MIFDYLKKQLTSSDNNTDNNKCIDDMGLSVKTYNCLKRSKIKTAGDLTKMTKGDLMRLRNLGHSGIKEIIRALDDLGLQLKEDIVNEESRRETTEYINNEEMIPYEKTVQPNEEFEVLYKTPEEHEEMTSEVEEFPQLSHKKMLSPRKAPKMMAVDHIKIETDTETIRDNEARYQNKLISYGIELNGLLLIGKDLHKMRLGINLEAVLDKYFSLRIGPQTAGGEKCTGFLGLDDDASLRDIVNALPCYSRFIIDASDGKSRNYNLCLHGTKIREANDNDSPVVIVKFLEITYRG